MFYNNEKFQEKYYNFISKAFGFDKAMKIVEVDFQKPWWKPIWDKRVIVGLDLTVEIIHSTTLYLIPLALGYIIYNSNYQLLFIFSFAYLLAELAMRLMIRNRAIYLMEIENSINYHAYKFFLTVDPIYHSTKSSGQIISKIERDSRSYGDMINLLLDSLVNTIISFVIAVATLFSFSLKLGLIAGLTFILLGLVNGLMSFLNAKSLIKRVINAKDKQSAVAQENLNQNALVRSSFATNEQDVKTKNLTIKLMKNRAISWFGSGIAITMNRMLFIISTVILSLSIMTLVSQGQVSSVVGVALIITFLSTSNNFLYVGSMIKNLTEQHAEIVDLFEFIRGFGKQTFPVLEKDLDNYR